MLGIQMTSKEDLLNIIKKEEEFILARTRHLI